MDDDPATAPKTILGDEPETTAAPGFPPHDFSLDSFTILAQVKARDFNDDSADHGIPLGAWGACS